jgi:hypothetical protein
MARIKVIGYMPLNQFTLEELDETRISGLTEQVENDIIEDIGENLDDISMELLADDGDEEFEAEVGKIL